MRDYLAPLLDKLAGRGLSVVMEPGRRLVGNAGLLLTSVEFLKPNAAKSFAIVDAAMNDLARPSLYGSYHAIVPVGKAPRGKVEADVVGPICESGDFLAKDRTMPAFKSGDYIAAMSAGAYGFSMSSNYNSRPRVAEVMVSGARYEVVRERETLKDLVRGEKTASLRRKTRAK